MQQKQLSIDEDSICNGNSNAPEPQYKYYLFYKTGWSLVVRALTLQAAVEDSSGEIALFQGVFSDMKSADKAGTELLQVDFPQVEDHY
ncbi:MAG: hypothetical protein Q8T09_11155 [Candidatus Melainabacteria bacterium]|nr:hypothetical protein [Candidatus Melainabacteria bacterium]